jgi:hypothetical protein
MRGSSRFQWYVWSSIPCRIPRCQSLVFWSGWLIHSSIESVQYPEKSETAMYPYILIVILSYLPIVNSVIMACVWYGVQAWIGVSCDYQAFYGCAYTCSNILVFV